MSLIFFRDSVSEHTLPERFTFPFYYDPHPLALQAVEELQAYVLGKEDFPHVFGHEDGGVVGIGKMIGVLVVENKDGKLGYLAGFSGKLDIGNHLSPFVPPVYDILDEEGFYRKGEEENNIVNRKVETLEADPDYVALVELVKIKEQEALEAVQAYKTLIKTAKKERAAKRATLQALSESERLAEEDLLNQESIRYHYRLKDLQQYWKDRLVELQEALAVKQEAIDALKKERKERSNNVQQRVFEQYTFLNIHGKEKSLYDIFKPTMEPVPPSGAGECAAPKLLQYAFLHGLKPIALAEFWWGQSPASEIRQHKQFYPACKSKCEPILGHMLDGIDMDDNPLLVNPALGRELPIVYEDEYLVVVNKPAEFLSVPGKRIEDSVQTRIQNLYPLATGPLIVHRLDMSTSGLLVLAMNKEVHQHLQAQFIKRKVKKRYVALLDGIVKTDKNRIEFPMRVDLEDRPRQMLCYEHGKMAITEVEIVRHEGDKTRVHFYPLTGRTHQLRVHAAHQLGLHTPIVGDDLYGKKAGRLYLHAAALGFKHPITGEWMDFEAAPDF